jgi:hypothetical protein
VPDDGSPGELDEVRDAAVLAGAGAVPEHPAVVPELVELAVIATDTKCPNAKALRRLTIEVTVDL